MTDQIKPQIKPMTQDRIRELIEAYGAAPERWPGRERDLAMVFIATSVEAQDLLKEASALDTALNALPMSEPSLALRRSVLDAFTPPIPVAANENDGLVTTITQWQPRSNRSWHKAAAAAVMFGVLCGVGISQTFAPASTVVLAQQPSPDFNQLIVEPGLESNVAALSLGGELPAIMRDTAPQNENSNDDVGDDSDIPLI